MDNDKFIPFSRPSFTKEELSAVERVLKSGWWSRGKVTEEFEEMFKRYCTADYALALNSCTAALHTGLKLINIGHEDEVITTPMTFCASANVIRHCGAKPVFADIDEETGLIDVENVRNAVTKNTKCIIPVDYAGNVADIDSINEIARSVGAYVLEDAAHSVASTYKGRHVGSLTDMTAFSFYATKNIATGEGGMLTLRDEKFYDYAKMLTLHGMSKNAADRYKNGGSHYYDIVMPGYKYNLTDIAAALGIVQLKRLGNMQAKRKEICNIYDSAFKDSKFISLLKTPDWCENGMHLYVIKLNLDTITISRDAFIKELYNFGIGTSVHFMPINISSYYKEHLGNVSMPKAERFYNRIISLPLYPSLSFSEVEYIAQRVLEVAQSNAR